MGTQKNRLIETVLLSTQNMLKMMGKKIFTFNFCFVYLNLWPIINALLLLLAFGEQQKPGYLPEGEDSIQENTTLIVDTNE